MEFMRDPETGKERKRSPGEFFVDIVNRGKGVDKEESPGTGKQEGVRPTEGTKALRDQEQKRLNLRGRLISKEEDEGEIRRKRLFGE